jgi:hypothetical protein
MTRKKTSRQPTGPSARGRRPSVRGIQDAVGSIVPSNEPDVVLSAWQELVIHLSVTRAPLNSAKEPGLAPGLLPAERRRCRPFRLRTFPGHEQRSGQIGSTPHPAQLASPNPRCDRPGR